MFAAPQVNIPMDSANRDPTTVNAIIVSRAGNSYMSLPVVAAAQNHPSRSGEGALGHLFVDLAVFVATEGYALKRLDHVRQFICQVEVQRQSEVLPLNQRREKAGPLVSR